LQKVIVTDIAAEHSPIFKKNKDGTYKRNKANELEVEATGIVDVDGYEFIDFQVLKDRRQQIVLQAVQEIEAESVNHNSQAPMHSGRRWYVDNKGIIQRP